MGPSLLHAEFVERAGQAAAGGPKQTETAVVPSPQLLIDDQGMLNSNNMLHPIISYKQKVRIGNS